MFPLAVVLVLAGSVARGTCEGHRLTYIYTAVSQNVAEAGIQRFTAMTLLDGQPIDYYDSLGRQKLPRTDWMSHKRSPEYWSSGTTTRQQKETWFKENMKKMMTRMETNDTALHIFQWRFECCGDKSQEGGALTFTGGEDTYGFDGEDFLSFDGANARWIAAVPKAEPTKNKWNNSPNLNPHTQSYMQSVCVHLLAEFLTHQEEHMRNATQPELFSWSRRSRTPSNVHLCCLATGLSAPLMGERLEVRSDGEVLTPADGVEGTGVRPNGDDTYQAKKCVEVPRTRKAQYDCYLQHRYLQQPIRTQIGQDTEVQRNRWLVLTPVVFLSLILALIGGVAYCHKNNNNEQTPPPSAMSPSNSPPSNCLHVRLSQSSE